MLLPQFDSLVGKICWKRDRLPTPVFLGFPCGSAGKESACNAGDLGSIPGLGRSPGEGKGYPLQDSGLENSMYCIVHGVAKNRTWLSDFHFTSLLLWRGWWGDASHLSLEVTPGIALPSWVCLRLGQKQLKTVLILSFSTWNSPERKLHVNWWNRLQRHLMQAV